MPSPAPPPELVRKGRYDTIWDRQGTAKSVIWEIILRDFWGDILRALLTRALNLCPIALHKALSSTTEDRHGVRWQTA